MKSPIKKDCHNGSLFWCNILQTRLTFEHIAVFLIEFVHATSRVNDFLFTGIERMTSRAYFNIESIFFHCGFSYKSITAGASHSYVMIVRLNAVIHSIVLS